MAELMGPIKALRRLFGRYVDFDGRSGRSAYAWAMLVLIGITAGFAIWLRTRTPAITVTSIFASDIIFIMIFLTYSILAVPYASLHVRRYRDAGLSPWILVLTVVIPLIALALESGVAYVDFTAYSLLLVNLFLGSLPSKRIYAY